MLQCQILPGGGGFKERASIVKIENGRSLVTAHQLQLSSRFFLYTSRASEDGTTELE